MGRPASSFQEAGTVHLTPAAVPSSARAAAAHARRPTENTFTGFMEPSRMKRRIPLCGRTQEDLPYSGSSRKREGSRRLRERQLRRQKACDVHLAPPQEIQRRL